MVRENYLNAWKDIIPPKMYLKIEMVGSQSLCVPSPIQHVSFTVIISNSCCVLLWLMICFNKMPQIWSKELNTLCLFTFTQQNIDPPKVLQKVNFFLYCRNISKRMVHSTHNTLYKSRITFHAIPRKNEEIHSNVSPYSQTTYIYSTSYETYFF